MNYRMVCSLLQVNLQREFVFRNSKKHYNGIPVIASNMDTVGTFEMAKILAEVHHTLLVTLYDVWVLCVYF